MTRGALSLAALALAAAACTEHVVAPGFCPDFCPSDSIEVADTIFTDVVVRDSAFSGYVPAHEGELLAVADLPGIVDSRGLFLLNAMFTRVIQVSGDTITVPITVDSSLLQLQILRRDTSTANLSIKLYRLPLTLDSNTTFDSVASDFAAAPVDSANVDSLLARPLITDTSLTGRWGGPFRTDSAGHVLQVAAGDSSLILSFILDTIQAPFVVADSGKLGFGVRVSADSLASISLGANHPLLNRDAAIRRYYHYTGKDSAGVADSTIFPAPVTRETTFDTFVFDPPTPPLDAAAQDTSLAVGGAPSVHSILRVDIPSLLRDSADVVRATLILVPIAPVPGARGDSFAVVARPVISDLGAKSPLGTIAELWGGVTAYPNTADTVRIEITNLIRVWAQDTSAATALVLGQVPEASSYAQIRFYSSRVPAFRPALRVTYVRRFPFGRP